jgi:hypothetical protein
MRVLECALGSELSRRSGGVMLSGVDTLRPGSAYIMGLNPGGNPAAPGYERSIFDSIHDRRDFSCYTDECWQSKCAGPAGQCEHLNGRKVKAEFLVKHQRNAIAIATALGLDITDIFSANAIFARSTRLATLKEQTGHDLEEWWAACWKVHQQFLAIVRPKVIISLGYGTNSSAFGLLWREAKQPEYRRIGEHSRRGGWTFDAEFPLPNGSKLSTAIIGVPHPSYMMVGPELAAELSRLRISS